MTYIRTDYAVTFFIIYTLLSMLREMYKDYKFKIKPTDYDSGYNQSLNDIATKWNEGSKNNLSDLEQVQQMQKFLQSKLDGR